MLHQSLGSLNEKQVDYANGILDASHKLLHFVNDVLDFASTEAGCLALQPHCVDIHSLLKDVCDFFAERTMAKQPKITLSCEETIVRCLHAIKEAFIQLQQLPDALTCSALLLELSPDDPYERRDRGFLLHQLDCLSLAFKDYDFFIRQCPRDPVAELLKTQMQAMPNPELVLH